MDGEKHLLIVAPWVVGPLTVAIFDEKKTELPGVSAGGEVRACGRVRVSTIAYNNQVPGPILRVREGVPVTIDVMNQSGRAEIVHWHAWRSTL